MTFAAPTSTLLAGAPTAEGQLAPPAPDEPRGAFDFCMTQASSRPESRAPQSASADSAPDGQPDAPTQRAAPKGGPRQDQDAEAGGVLCWLPNWLGAQVCQPVAPAETPVRPARFSTPAPAAEEAADALDGWRPEGSSLAASEPSKPEDSSGAKADPEGPAPDGAGPAAPKAPLVGPHGRGVASKLAEGAGTAEAEETGRPAPAQNGMSSAAQTTAMPAPTEVNEITCPGEQKLPGAGAEISAPGAEQRERGEGGAGAGEDSSLSAGAVQPGSPAPTAQAGPELAAHTEPLTSGIGAVEAVRRAVEDAAAGLERGNGGSVSLVLNPDPHTQLSLSVKLQQGHIEALAVLEHGDLGALGAQWSQLQGRLAEQGVRLAPLVPGTAHSMSLLGGESGSARQERHSEDAAPTRESSNQPPLVRMGVPGSAARNKSLSSQREWWA